MAETRSAPGRKQSFGRPSRAVETWRSIPEAPLFPLGHILAYGIHQPCGLVGPVTFRPFGVAAIPGLR
jgi:hypothetical protein